MWIYKDKEVSDEDIQGYVAFVYLITNLQSGKKYIGKKLTVRFQELTDDKVPRFPVGITFRDYE